MSIDQTQKECDPFFRLATFKSSHRTLPEQCVGLGIFLALSFAFELFNGWLAQNGAATGWKWTIYHALAAFAMWSLWRRYSLRTLKVELSLFFTLLVLQTFWILSSFVAKANLLALGSLLFLWSASLLSLFLFWKRERISGWILILPFFRLLYIVAMNLLNP
jgi:tryptophan-rich sensory protein